MNYHTAWVHSPKPLKLGTYSTLQGAKRALEELKKEENDLIRKDYYAIVNDDGVVVW